MGKTVYNAHSNRPKVTHFDCKPVKRNRQAVLVDRTPLSYRADRNEFVKQFLADERELCDPTATVEVHDMRALHDLNVKGQQEKPK